MAAKPLDVTLFLVQSTPITWLMLLFLAKSIRRRCRSDLEALRDLVAAVGVGPGEPSLLRAALCFHDLFPRVLRSRGEVGGGCCDGPVSVRLRIEHGVVRSGVGTRPGAHRSSMEIAESKSADNQS